MEYSDKESEFRGMIKGFLWTSLIKNVTNGDWYMHLFCEFFLFCDNKVVLDIARNLIQHDHIKHVEIDWYFIKQKYEVEIIVKILFLNKTIFNFNFNFVLTPHSHLGFIY